MDTNGGGKSDAVVRDGDSDGVGIGDGLSDGDSEGVSNV